MAIEELVNSQPNISANVIESFYTSPAGGGGTVITAFTATNNTDANRTYNAYIFDSTGVPLEAVIPQRILIRKKFDTGSAIVNHVIPAGGSLRMESDAANSIVFRVTGNEL